MKYIRTKDGIYEYVDYDNECIIPMPIIKYKGRLTHCANCDIIKQADTIEELCDCYVIARKDGTTIGGELETLKEMLLQRDCDIEYEVDDDYFYYGAIWTDKGLIYVARMNEKGELELL